MLNDAVRKDDAGNPAAHLPPPVGAYAYARRAGGLLFLAGIGPRAAGTHGIPGVMLDAAGNVSTYDIESQVHQCFANVRAALAQHGARWEQIVDVTVFLTDLPRDFAAFNHLWAEYFADEATRPCRTTVEVSRLPQAGSAPINFEVKVVAAFS
ncbi:RidA family protein [soil metagenome]